MISAHKRQAYLEKRALRGPWEMTRAEAAPAPAEEQLRAALVIPACAEEEELPGVLASLAASNDSGALATTLILVVINSHPDTPVRERADNQRLLAALPALARSWPRLHLAWIDADSSGYQLPPDKAGVGMARRLGCDLALPLLQGEHPFLVWLDADSPVAPDYLGALHRFYHREPAAAAIASYAHRPARHPDEQLAINRYELYLRAHRLGLTLAGSPYAWHSIGSTISVSIPAWIAAGGSNLRPAGEDFYFLQQLSKVTRIYDLPGLRNTAVFPSSRCSSRTPFGTGRTVQALAEDAAPPAIFFPWSAYQDLSCWLHLLTREPCQSPAILRSRHRTCLPHLTPFLDRLNLEQILPRLQNNHKERRALQNALHTWFDALASLRLLNCRGKTVEEVAIPPLFSAAGLPLPATTEERLQLLRNHRPG